MGTAYPIARALADRRTRALWCPRDGEHDQTSIANAALNCCRNCFANFIEEMHEAVKNTRATSLCSLEGNVPPSCLRPERRSRNETFCDIVSCGSAPATCNWGGQHENQLHSSIINVRRCRAWRSSGIQGLHAQAKPKAYVVERTRNARSGGPSRIHPS